MVTVTDPLVTVTGGMVRDSPVPVRMYVVYDVPFQYETDPEAVAMGAGVPCGSASPLRDDAEADAEYLLREIRFLVRVQPGGPVTDVGSPPSETVPSDILAAEDTQPLVAALEHVTFPARWRDSKAVSGVAPDVTLARTAVPRGLVPA